MCCLTAQGILSLLMLLNAFSKSSSGTAGMHVLQPQLLLVYQNPANEGLGDGGW